MTTPRASPRPHTSLRRRITNTPLAIEVNALEGILALLEDRRAGVMLTSEAQAAWAAANPAYGAAPTRGRGDVALIALHGPLALQVGQLEAMSGITSTRAFAAAVRHAADDPGIGEIVLDVDSPGGTVDSVDTAVQAVRYAATRKRVTAVTEGTMASAAYWIASQATRVVASPNAAVGSISVIYTHADWSQADADEGVKYSILTTGDKKALGNPHEPLGDDGKAELMRLATAYHSAFVTDVAAGRNRSVESVQRDWADGRVETGITAKTLGLVDATGTLAEVLSDLTHPATKKGAATVKLTDVAAILRDAPRLGAETDDEGTHYIQVSDKLATEMAAALDAEADAVAAAKVDAAAAQAAAETLATATNRQRLAQDLIRSAALQPVSNDADAAFERRCTSEAQAAPDDQTAAAAVTALLEDRRALLAAASTGDNHPNLPSSNEAHAAAETQAELARIRRGAGLPN